MVKLAISCKSTDLLFESVVILDSGKTSSVPTSMRPLFESVVILDSGKTNMHLQASTTWFESVVILDSGKTIT